MPPIACSLSATELSARLEAMARIGRDALTAVEVAPGRARLLFEARPEIRSRLDEIVAAELECCAFLSMTVADQDGVISLTIEAPAEAQPVVTDLVDAFRGLSTVGDP